MAGCSDDAPTPTTGAEQLYRIGGDEPAIFRLGGGAREFESPMVSALEGLRPAAMSRTERIVAQNDVWGLIDRLGGESTALRRAARAAMNRLALPARSFGTGPPVFPSQLVGFAEFASELPSLQHERAYGNRRIFSIALSDDLRGEPASRRALFSRLVAVDDGGKRRRSEVVGEIEELIFEDASLSRARVWELDRSTFALREVDRVRHVPGEGADHFIFAEEAPVALADLPCLRCHDDDQMMSLPTNAVPPDWRLERLLDRPPPD